MVGVYPADHYIKNVDTFKKNINEINEFINNNVDSICTLGIKPSYPSTSYGYINCEVPEDNKICKVSSFKEKPNLESAKELIKKDNFVWNSGMFFFNVSTMINQIDTYQPEIKELYASIDYNQNNLSDKINSIWDKMPKISIDYAVMEKSNDIYCMKSEFGWSDLGTWVSLYELLDKDANNNVHKGDILNHNAKNNLVISDNKLVSVVGLNNIGVINHNGKILVIDLEKSEEVRHIISQLDNKDK
jgi:mannose-1-phosphate guanylyltransferase